MKSFHQWVKENPEFLEKPWLLLGKGPSYSSCDQINANAYYTIGLNHVVQDRPVDLAHCIDIEVLEHCSDTLSTNAGYLVMPWVPHVKGKRGLLRRTYFGPDNLTLEDYCDTYPVLREMADQHRLLWYNLASSPRGLFRAGYPSIDAGGFSASAVINLLSSVGVREIRTLGIDGGNRYSHSFEHLKKTTLLPTRHQSFDVQFKAIAKTLFENHINLEPLNMESPIRIYVGTQPEQELATRVLEYSIKKSTSMAVVVEPLYKAIEEADIRIPQPKRKSQRGKTPFSFQRFAIPMLKGFSGRAIYLDSDMQVFRDIREVWSLPFEDAQILSVNETSAGGRRPQFSVMLIDCEALRWNPTKLIEGLDEGRWSYDDLMYKMVAAPNISASIPGYWNELERYNETQTGLTHYTEMNTQPWLNSRNLLGKIWCRDLFQAIEDQFIDSEMITDHIQRGWVRPSLGYQLEHGIVDPLLLPKRIVRADDVGFVPPHRTMTLTHKLTGYGTTPGPLQMLARRIYARARWLLELSQLRPLMARIKRRVLG